MSVQLCTIAIFYCVTRSATNDFAGRANASGCLLAAAGGARYRRGAFQS
jgi:hypothetical protein